MNPTQRRRWLVALPAALAAVPCLVAGGGVLLITQMTYPLHFAGAGPTDPSQPARHLQAGLLFAGTLLILGLAFTSVAIWAWRSKGQG